MNKKPSHEELEKSVEAMEPGDHLCFIYETEKEHRALFTQFIRQGLERGEKMLYIMDAHTKEEVLNYLRDDGMVVEPYLESGQLIIIKVDEAYMREEIFDPDAMIEMLRDETERSLEEGYSALRVTGEMTWALEGLRGSERLIEYEAKLNEFLADSKCLAICQYDKRRFKPALLSDVLATHPIAIIGTEVFDNFYYVPPEDFLSPDPEAAKLNKRLNSLLELKQAGKALYESEEKYRRLFEEARDGIILADGETGILVDCNYEATRLVDRDKSELIGQHQRILHPPSQDNEKFSETFQKHLKEGAGRVLETQVITSAGEIKDVAIKANLFYIGNRKLLQGTFHDITDRKRAEESLKLFRALIERSNDAIEVIDPKTGHFLDINEKACADLGYSREEFLSLRVFDIDPKIDPSLYTEVLMKELRETGSLRSESLHLRKDGSTFPVEINLSYVQLDRDYLVTVARDITDRKRMEEELLKVQKLESVGILAGGIAHDFNNILTAIIGNISLAKNQVTPEDEIFDLLNEVEMASTRAQTLTKQLLTFAKGGTPVKETASIKDIIKESTLFALRGSKSSYEFSIAEDIWPVEVDVGQFNQVINNIVINANQAMPLGGTIKVAVQNLIIEDRDGLPIKPGRYIGISITDQGIGISEEYLSKIFDPYFTTKQEGSGLGLAISYSIIKRHDGCIRVESKLDVGTTFHIYLPASEKAVTEKRKDKVIKGRGKILVMDDEASLRKIVGRMLDKLGYEPEFAKDGDEAIQMVKEAKEAKKPYDAIILDLTVPGGRGGKETIQKLLEIDPEVKAIVSSGYSNDSVLANFQEYGFKGMMPKPFESLSLSKVLHEVLQGEKLNIED